MIGRQRKRLIAAVSASAYLCLATGASGQLVYCAGADGHAGIEQSHPDGHCTQSARAAGASSDATRAHEPPCTDTPLLTELATILQKLENPSGCAAAPLPPATLPVMMPDRAPTCAHLGTPSPPASNLRVARSLRTTVLRV